LAEKNDYFMVLSVSLDKCLDSSVPEIGNVTFLSVPVTPFIQTFDLM